MEYNHSLKYRVVLFLPSIETGGVERNAIMVANYLVNSCVPVTVVYTRSVNRIRARFDKRVDFKPIGEKIRIPLIHPRISDAVVVFLGFLKYITQLKEPLVVLSFQSNIVSIIACRLVNKPVVVRVSNHPSHTQYESGKVQKIAERLKRIVYRFADAVITNSKMTSSCFREFLPVPVHTVYNPVNIEHVAALAKETTEHPWLENKNKPVVIAVGRLATQKNFSMLLHAFTRVVEQVDARLIILGEGRERIKLEALRDALGLAESVSFPGYYENVHAFVIRSDLFVLSSNFEGMPNSLLEAVAVGTPVVSTNCLSGPSEITDNGRGGDLVPIGDVRALADVIVENLKNRKSAFQKLAIAKKQLDEFRYLKVMLQYQSLLDKVSNSLFKRGRCEK